MQAMCPVCCGEVSPKPTAAGKPKVYCSVRCKATAKQRRRYTPGPPAATTVRFCEACGVLTGRPKYCSRSCMEQVKVYRRTERYRNDPEFRARYRERQARYDAQRGVVPRPPKVDSCSFCSRPHLARGLCRNHYQADRRKRGLDQQAPDRWSELTGLTRYHGMGGAVALPVEVTVSAGVLARCPLCSVVMGALSRSGRWCPRCHTTVELNPDEISWLSLPDYTDAVAG